MVKKQFNFLQCLFLAVLLGLGGCSKIDSEPDAHVTVVDSYWVGLYLSQGPGFPGKVKVLPSLIDDHQELSVRDQVQVLEASKVMLSQASDLERYGLKEASHIRFLWDFPPPKGWELSPILLKQALWKIQKCYDQEAWWTPEYGRYWSQEIAFLDETDWMIRDFWDKYPALGFWVVDGNFLQAYTRSYKPPFKAVGVQNSHGHNHSEVSTRSVAHVIDSMRKGHFLGLISYGNHPLSDVSKAVCQEYSLSVIPAFSPLSDSEKHAQSPGALYRENQEDFLQAISSYSPQ